MPDQAPTPVSDPNAALLQSSIAAGTAQIATPTGGSYAAVQPTSPVVSTSTPAQNVVNNIGNNISSGQGNQPILPTPSNPTGSPAVPNSYPQFDGTYGPNPDPYGFGSLGYNASTDPRVSASGDTANTPYISREAQLQQQRDAEITRLGTQQATDQATLAQTQKAETATSSRNLAYLQQGGTSASAQAYLVSLDASHQTEMSTLTAKYNAAIATAQSAFNDKDFALAEAMVKNAKDIKTEAQKRNQDFLDTTLKIRAQADTEAKQQYDQGAAQRTQNAEILKFAQTNGLHPNAPFFESGGMIYSAADGSPVGSSKEEALAAGVSPDLSNVQMIQTADKARTGILGELDDYNAGLKEAGKAPLNIIQYRDLKQRDAVAIAAAGRAQVNISAAQQQFALTQEQAAYLSAVNQGWKTNNYIQGNGTISSKDYKVAKQSFVQKFGAAAGPAFDSAMAVFVDSHDTKNYQADYGLNKSIPGSPLQ